MIWILPLAYFIALYGLRLISSRGYSRLDTGTDYYAESQGEATGSLADPFIGQFGVSVSTIYDIDLSSSSFYLEGYTWLKWEKVPDWLKEYDEEVYQCPLRSINFVNAVDRQDLQVALEPSSPVHDVDQQMIQWLSFSGKFVASKLDLRLFPFEVITLPVEIEFDDFYAGEANISYLSSGPILTTTAAINGYNLRNVTVNPCHHVYATNWGFEYSKGYFGRDNYTEFIAFVVAAVFRRDPWNSFLNIFLPLLIVMAVVLAAPLVAIQDYQTKLAIPASALLVLVFLQDSYKKILPPGLNYPTLADLIYIYNMYITIIVFIWSLFQTKAYLNAETIGRAADHAQAAGSLDNVFFVITLFFFVAGPAIFYKTCKSLVS
jgi:hypothetical protein